jgi:hypothetical protein
MTAKMPTTTSIEAASPSTPPLHDHDQPSRFMRLLSQIRDEIYNDFLNHLTHVFFTANHSFTAFAFGLLLN